MAAYSIRSITAVDADRAPTLGGHYYVAIGETFSAGDTVVARVGNLLQVRRGVEPLAATFDYLPDVSCNQTTVTISGYYDTGERRAAAFEQPTDIALVDTASGHRALALDGLG